MNNLVERIKNEPALLMGFLQALIALLLAFGVELTQQQVAALLGLSAASLAIVTRQLVTPNRKIDSGDGSGGSAGGPMGSRRSNQSTPYSSRCVALVFAIAVLAVGCESCTKNGHTPLSWPAAVSCIDDPLEIVGDVADVLINDYGGKELSAVGKQKLEELAVTKGTPAVLCLVDRLVREWVAPAMADDPNRRAAAARGEAFLRTVGTKIDRH